MKSNEYIVSLSPYVSNEFRTFLHRYQNITFEPPNHKTNKMTCAPIEDSDQPGHPQLSIERTANTLIRLGGCPSWSESSLGAQIILLVLSWGGSFICVFGQSNHETAKSDELSFTPKGNLLNFVRSCVRNKKTDGRTTGKLDSFKWFKSFFCC